MPQGWSAKASKTTDRVPNYRRGRNSKITIETILSGSIGYNKCSKVKHLKLY